MSLCRQVAAKVLLQTSGNEVLARRCVLGTVYSRGKRKAFYRNHTCTTLNVVELGLMLMTLDWEEYVTKNTLLVSYAMGAPREQEAMREGRRERRKEEGERRCCASVPTFHSFINFLSFIFTIPLDRPPCHHRQTASVEGTTAPLRP